MNTPRSLDEQRREFVQRRGLAMPLAGAVAWTIVGVAGAFLPPGLEVWVLFGATGSILYLGMFFSRFTGENFLAKERPKNAFDGLPIRLELKDLGADMRVQANQSQPQGGVDHPGGSWAGAARGGSGHPR